MPVDLSLIMSDIGIDHDPMKALYGLLQRCADHIGATRGSIFRLHLSETAYVEDIVSGGRPSHRRRLSLLAGTDVEDAALRETIDDRSARALNLADPHRSGANRRCSDGSRLLVPMLRDDVCTGVFDLYANTMNHFTLRHQHLLELASGVALLLDEKEYALNLLEQLQRPISYEQSFESFLDDVMLSVATAARMPYIALRRLSGDSLLCLRGFGLGEDTTRLNITPIDRVQSFDRAVRSRKLQIEHNVDTLYSQPGFGELAASTTAQSYAVAPILVGNDVYGTLSFAVACPHRYTALEQHGLTTIANAVGVALSNYHNFQESKELIFEAVRDSAAITTVEVAQGARHEARSHLQHAQELLTLLKRGGVGRPSEDMTRLVGNLSGSLVELGRDLDKIRMVTKLPESRVTRVDLSDLWEEAFGVVSGRLESLDVHYSVSAAAEADVRADVARDYMRHAFLNLILNSVDAFADSKRKKNRRITVQFIKQFAKDKMVRMRFVDNAKGIDLYNIRGLPADRPVDAGAIFLPGVTSKANGTGYGMYLVRKVLRDHKGSIDLVDYDRGVVFDLQLPRSN